MKKILLTLVLLVGVVFGLMAQNLTYQAVVRDNNQQLVTNTAVKATVTITFSTGNPYSEEINATTNIHGLLSIEFGGDALNGRNWEGATIAVKVVNKNDESTVYVNGDARPVSAVPYALSVNGQSIQNYLTEHNYVDLTKLNDTLSAYPTTAVMNSRHYLTSDSAVITTMQSDISKNAGSIDNLILHTAKNAIRDSVAGQIHDSIKTVAAKAHTHDNKGLLDTYDQTNADLKDAVEKAHIHGNADILNSTTAPYTDADSIKLKGIEAGAQKNVQSDWKQIDGSKDDYIKNKPSIRDTVNTILSTGGYVTADALDSRHYLRSDSTVITTMQGNITANATNITSLQSGLSAAISKEKTDSTTLAGRIDALEGAAMDCNKVKDCIKDTLSNYSTTAALNDLLQQLTARLDAQDTKIDAQNAKMDSLARIVDSLSNLTPGGGDTTEVADGQPCPGAPTVSDGTNTYNTVKIGSQCWTKENLRTTKYADGTSIDNSKMFNPDGSEDNVATYGKLYTWSAATRDSSTTYPAAGQVKVQGICPTGWHVPSNAEWDTLTRYVFSKDEYKCGDDCGTWQAQSDVSCIANALSSTTGWNSSTSEGCNAGNMGDKANAIGFSAVPAGSCFGGSFGGFGLYAYFWSATQYDDYDAWCRYLNSHDSYVFSGRAGKDRGFSVRCLRD